MTKVPEVNFHFREYDEDTKKYQWHTLPSSSLFRGPYTHQRVLIFALPGAFTPTCSEYQLPTYEDYYDKFRDLGVKEIYCLSVNDAFVMNAWFKELGIKKVKALPDGSGEFTEAMGMLVNKANLGFGKRSWRYAMIVKNNEIEMMFKEEGMIGNCQDDPYEISTPKNVYEWLRKNPETV